MSNTARLGVWMGRRIPAYPSARKRPRGALPVQRVPGPGTPLTAPPHVQIPRSLLRRNRGQR